jgi:hypothetical protein
MLLLGEVRTSPLHHSGAVAHHVVADLLGVVPGRRVQIFERPIARGISPELMAGVDCGLPTKTGARPRAIGTIAARAVVTGGWILQGSAYVRVDRGAVDHRLPWSHYLSRPGVVETIGRADEADVQEGFLDHVSPASTLDLGAVAERLIGTVQMHAYLDHIAPFKARRTRMRWAALTGGDQARELELALEADGLRTLRMKLPALDIQSVVEFCEDLAFHDWALTTLLQMVERADLGSAGGADAIARLGPAIDHLLHLWMPGAHVGADLLPLWEALERRPGFSRQWDATVGRIRDQLALRTLTMLGNEG